MKKKASKANHHSQQISNIKMKKKASKATKATLGWQVGTSYFIRTVTMHLTGRLVSVGEHELVIEDASWVADSGRFANALKTGVLSEVEPFPDGLVIVGRGSIVDASIWAHPLPRTQK